MKETPCFFFKLEEETVYMYVHIYVYVCPSEVKPPFTFVSADLKY